MALILAIFSVVLITHIVTELIYETNVEYLVNSKSVQRVKAYYAARSGIEISLLRIKIFNQIQAQFGASLAGMGGMAKMVDMIWSMPFMWPPIIPGEINAVDKDMIEEKIKASTMDSNYQTSIVDEGTKIDVNDLDSPSKSIKASTRKLLLKIFETKKEQDEVWDKSHKDFKPEELINNITDWIDADKEALNGGAESQMYGDLKDQQDLGFQYPPNRFFRSVEELRLVAGMTDEIFQFLAPRVTVFGSKSINPNSAPLDLIQSLDPSIEDKVIQEFQKRRSDPQQAPFQSKDEFWNFLDAHGARVSKEVKESTPLSFSKATNFRIKSLGEYKGAVRQIEVVVYDGEQSIGVVTDAYKKDQNPPSASGNPGPKPSPPKPNQTASKGPPRIVYWTEN